MHHGQVVALTDRQVTQAQTLRQVTAHMDISSQKGTSLQRDIFYRDIAQGEFL